jgi:hypothetical protein
VTEAIEALKAWFVPPPMPPMPALPFGAGRGVAGALALAWKACYLAGVRDGAVAGAAVGVVAAILLLNLARTRETPR